MATLKKLRTVFQYMHLHKKKTVLLLKTSNLCYCYYSIAKEDCMVRVTILTMLSKLQADIPEQANLGYAISRELLNQQKESLNVYSYRNFGNSLSHRRKHRSFCALMVLHHFLESVSDVTIVYFVYKI